MNHFKVIVSLPSLRSDYMCVIRFHTGHWYRTVKYCTVPYHNKVVVLMVVWSTCSWTVVTVVLKSVAGRFDGSCVLMTVAARDSWSRSWQETGVVGDVKVPSNVPQLVTGFHWQMTNIYCIIAARTISVYGKASNKNFDPILLKFDKGKLILFSPFSQFWSFPGYFLAP